MTRLIERTLLPADFVNLVFLFFRCCFIFDFINLILALQAKSFSSSSSSDGKPSALGTWEGKTSASDNIVHCVDVDTALLLREKPAFLQDSMQSGARRLCDALQS